MTPSFKIAIVGGGPVGLTLAVLLQRAGHAVTVYERDAGPDARIDGGTLDLHHDSGQQPLRAAGLLEEFYRLARPTAGRAADSSGAILHDEVLDETNRYERPEIDRADLRRVLLGGLAADTVVWGRRLAELRRDGEAWRLRFENGETAGAELVVGADGGRSRVRPYVTDAEPRPTGTFVVQGEIAEPTAACPAFAALVNGGNLMARGGGTMLFAQTRADRRSTMTCPSAGRRVGSRVGR